MEALLTVSLATGALALALWAGAAARDNGFRIANRATQAAEAELAAEVFGVLVAGLAWPTGGGGAAPEGQATSLSGPAILERAIPCAPAGPAAVRLGLERRAGRTLLTCAASDRPPLVLADLGPGEAAFSYSADGARWFGSWPEAAGETGRVFVRLSTPDGSIDWIAAAPAREQPRDAFP